MFAGATRDRTPAEIASDANRELQDGRNHNDAFGLVEQVLRDSVGDVHDFLQHLAALQIHNRNRPLARDVPHRVHAHERSLSGWPRHNGAMMRVRFSWGQA